MEEFIATFGALGIISLFILAIVIAILYLFLPFAIFGIKPLLKHQNELLVKQNKILIATLEGNREASKANPDVDKMDK